MTYDELEMPAFVVGRDGESEEAALGATLSEAGIDPVAYVTVGAATMGEWQLRILADTEHKKRAAVAVMQQVKARRIELVSEPGTIHSYNDYNFLALAVIVERVTGRGFVSYVEQEIFEPAGMTHTAYRSSPTQPLARSVLPREAAPDFVAVMEANGRDGNAMIDKRCDAYVSLLPYDILPGWAGVKSTPEAAPGSTRCSASTPHGSSPSSSRRTAIPRQSARSLRSRRIWAHGV